MLPKKHLSKKFKVGKLAKILYFREIDVVLPILVLKRNICKLWNNEPVKIIYYFFYHSKSSLKQYQRISLRKLLYSHHNVVPSYPLAFNFDYFNRIFWKLYFCSSLTFINKEGRNGEGFLS